MIFPDPLSVDFALDIVGMAVAAFGLFVATHSEQCTEWLLARSKPMRELGRVLDELTRWGKQWLRETARRKA